MYSVHTTEQKCWLIDLRNDNPDFKHSRLAEEFKEKFGGVLLTRSTVSDWLKPAAVKKVIDQSNVRRLAPLIHDEIVIEEEVVTEGPSNRPMGNDYDLGVTIAMMHLTDAIHDLGLAVNVHEDDIFDGIKYCNVAGEESSHEHLEDVALVDLVMSANAPTL